MWNNPKPAPEFQWGWRDKAVSHLRGCMHVCAVPDLPRRAKRYFTVDHTLGSGPPPWGEAIQFVLFRGGILMKADFFHVQPATWILTDLIENFAPARVRSPCYRALVRTSGEADPDGKAPIDMLITFLGNRAALRAAVGLMIAWQPERVILAHGRWYEHNGVRELRDGHSDGCCESHWRVRVEDSCGPPVIDAMRRCGDAAWRWQRTACGYPTPSAS